MPSALRKFMVLKDSSRSLHIEDGHFHLYQYLITLSWLLDIHQTDMHTDYYLYN